MPNVSFSYTPTKLAIVGTAVLAALVMIVVVVFGINPNKPQPGPNNSTQYPANLAALANGCGDIYMFQPAINQYGQIPNSLLQSGGTIEVPLPGMVVPVFGYMSAKPLADSQIRFYGKNELQKPIDRTQILRTMYDRGTTVVWYDQTISPGDYTALENYVKTHKNILAVKWEYGTALPVNRTIAFSTWGISQTCQFWNNNTFKDFQKFANEHPVNHPATPPTPKLTSQGKLPTIDRPRNATSN